MRYRQTSNYTGIKNNKRLLLGGIWIRQNVTTQSRLSLAKHYIKANKIGVVVATTLSTGSKHTF